MIKKIAVAISGASGVELGLKFFDLIPDGLEKFLIISEHAKIVLEKETNNKNIYENKMIWAPPASGSFGVDATCIIPCSMNTLAKISCGISDNLVSRVAAVALKEGKKLLLSPREIPFDQISLSNMLKLSQMGAIIAPAIYANYAKIENLEQLENYFIGKWFDLLGIENNLYKRWEG